MKHTILTATVAAIAALAAVPAHADTTAQATTDLNIRSGPGPQYEPIGVIAGGDNVVVDGCVEASSWCQVTYGGQTGWSYGEYLQASVQNEQVVVVERRDQLQVPFVSYDGGSEGAAVGAAGGAITGALIGGPVGAAVGGVAGAVGGAAIDPPQPVGTYVVENPAEPVYLEGEVVVGASVPEAVVLTPVPDYDYQYAYVNGQAVLIDPQTRQIVHVYR